VSALTHLSGLIQICQLISRLEKQVVQGVANRSQVGGFYDLIDRSVHYISLNGVCKTLADWPFQCKQVLLFADAWT